MYRGINNLTVLVNKKINLEMNVAIAHRTRKSERQCHYHIIHRTTLFTSMMRNSHISIHKSVKIRGSLEAYHTTTWQQQPPWPHCPSSLILLAHRTTKWHHPTIAHMVLLPTPAEIEKFSSISKRRKCASVIEKDSECVCVCVRGREREIETL